MKVAIMQPYFFPYIGYWQLLHAADTFVIYDDVNYIKRGWVNRNRLLENGKPAYFNVLLKDASQNKHINEIARIEDCRTEQKLLRRIKTCYEKAPFFKQIYPIIESLITLEEEKLAKYLTATIVTMAQALEIEVNFELSSEIDKNSRYKGQDRILHICSELGADMYCNAIGGQKLYNREVFKQNNINLFFLKTDTFSYPQFKNEFVPALSIIDVLMFNGIEKTREYLKLYTMV